MTPFCESHDSTQKFTMTPAPISFAQHSNALRLYKLVTATPSRVLPVRSTHAAGCSPSPSPFSTCASAAQTALETPGIRTRR